MPVLVPRSPRLLPRFGFASNILRTGIRRLLSFGPALALLLAACSNERDPTAPAEPANSSAAAQPDGVADTPSSATDRARPRSAPALAVEAQGLRLFDRRSGSARPLAFGLSRAQVMRALEFRRGAEAGRNPECGAGPLEFARWPDGLTLYFEHGRFAGWALADPGGGDAVAGSEGPATAGGTPQITTAAGIGLGSTRAQLESAYDAEIFDSSLGTEFSAENLFGLLEGPQPSARISAMWAGASCVMR